MEAHRKNPSCAVCHVRMDPLGFSLENFDALGKWRTSSRCAPDRCVCSASGRHEDSTAWPACASCWPSHQEDFARTFTQKLLGLCARTQRRIDRPSGDSADHEERGAGRLPMVVAHRRHRPKHAVHDEHDAAPADQAPVSTAHSTDRSSADADHEESHSAAHGVARPGRDDGAAAARRDGAGADGTAEHCRQADQRGSASCTCRTAWS